MLGSGIPFSRLWTTLGSSLLEESVIQGDGMITMKGWKVGYFFCGDTRAPLGVEDAWKRCTRAEVDRSSMLRCFRGGSS